MAAVTLMKGNAPPEGLAGFGENIDYREVGSTVLKLASVAGLGYVTMDDDVPGWARVLTGLAALQQGLKLLKRVRGASSPLPEPPAETPDGTPIVSVAAGTPLQGYAAAPQKYRAANLRVRT